MSTSGGHWNLELFSAQGSLVKDNTVQHRKVSKKDLIERFGVIFSKITQMNLELSQKILTDHKIIILLFQFYLRISLNGILRVHNLS